MSRAKLRLPEWLQPPEHPWGAGGASRRIPPLPPASVPLPSAAAAAPGPPAAGEGCGRGFQHIQLLSVNDD